MRAIVVVVLGLVCAFLVLTGLVTAAAALVLARRNGRHKPHRSDPRTDGKNETDGPSEM
jgi:hypothetical protein